MILSFVAAAVVQSGNAVTEYVDPTAGYVSVQALVKLPSLTGRNLALEHLLAETITDEVSDYGRVQMRDMAALAGDSLKVTLMPDHLRIQIGVLPRDLGDAIGFMSSILRNSKFPADSLNRAIAEVPYRKRGIWSLAVQPYQPEFKRIRREDVIEFYHRVCQPQNVWLTVGGPIQFGEGQAIWTRKTADWKPTTLPPEIPAPDLPVPVKAIPGAERIIELRGAEIQGKDVAMASRILALIALGSGKGSSLFERAREGHGWSYRQEALLWPSAGGFVPRLVIASGDLTPPLELAADLKTELLAAVDAWTESDLLRALGMARGIFERGFETSPLYFNPAWPVTDSLHDRTFLAGYWTMKTGEPWDTTYILRQMSAVKVADLKDIAKAMLESSQPFVVDAVK